MNEHAFGIAFSPLDRARLADEIVRDPVPQGHGPRTVLTANVDHIVQLARNEEFRECYRRAWVATADGMPVYLYAAVRGAPVSERLTGADLFDALMRELSPDAHRCFFVASSTDTAGKLISYLRGRGFPPDALACDVPPFGFERDQGYSQALSLRIAEHRATHLFMGVGAPKSEIWTHRHRERIGDCYALHVGAALDFFVGARRRAPVCMQKCGLEWAWRFAQEPRRLFKRYWIESLLFLKVLVQERQTPLIGPRPAPSGRR